jgi:hypothetical protein
MSRYDAEYATYGLAAANSQIARTTVGMPEQDKNKALKTKKSKKAAKVAKVAIVVLRLASAMFFGI